MKLLGNSHITYILSIFLSFLVLSSIVFAVGSNTSSDDSQNVTLKQITKLIDFVFDTFGFSARLVLDNDTGLNNPIFINSIENSKIYLINLYLNPADTFEMITGISKSQLNQKFEDAVNLLILNVQSYPTVGKYWTVRFNTTGAANLTITAINGTTFGDQASNDLVFEMLRCGDAPIDYSWTNDSIFVDNYSCAHTSYETSKVLTTGKHHLKFTFGDKVDFANNLATQINISLILTPSNPNPGDNVTVSGQAMYDNGTVVGNNNLSLFLDGLNINVTDVCVYDWWNLSWKYRNEIVLNSTVELTDNPIKYIVNWTENMNTIFDDLRFVYYNRTDSTQTELYYWLEHKNDGVNATVFFKTNLSVGNNSVYVYYGNNVAQTKSDRSNILVFYEDFTNANNWDAVGTAGIYTDGTTPPVGRTYAYKNGAGTVTSTLTSKIGLIGDGNFSVTLNIKNTGSKTSGSASYSHRLQFPNSTTSEDTTSYPTNYVSKTYLLDGTDVRLRLYSSATGYTYTSSSYCSGDAICNAMGRSDCDNDGYCAWIDGSTTYYSATSTVYVDDIYVLKYSPSNPSIISVSAEQLFMGTNSTGDYCYNFTVPETMGTYNLNVNMTDSNGITGTNTTFFDVRTLLFDTFNISDSTGKFDNILNPNEAYNFSVRIFETNSTVNYTVSTGAFNITISDIEYPLIYTGANSIWMTETTYGTVSSIFGTYSFFANVSGTSGNAIIGTENNINYTFYVKNITLTENLNVTYLYPGETMFVSGKATLNPDGINLVAKNVSLWIDNLFEINSTTNSTGDYNYTFTASNSKLGVNVIKVNLTDENGITAQNTTTFEIWAPTKLNYTDLINYTNGENTEHNITVNFFRTDLNTPQNALINITIGNDTLSLSKTCIGQSSCQKAFTFGPTGDMPGGNYTMNISVENNSAYFVAKENISSYYFEEPKASVQLNTQNKDITDFVFGEYYSFLHNVTLNNSIKASIYNAEIFNATLPTKIESIVPLNNCASRIFPNDVCIITFNITMKQTASGTTSLSWKLNWTDNDNTTTEMTIQNTVVIQGNAQMNVSIGNIDIKNNLSESKIFYVNVSNIGNLELTNAGANKPYPSWMVYESVRDNEEGWDSQYWTKIYLADYHTMKINITVKNYTDAYYLNTINFTNDEGNLKLINLSINVSPELTVEPYLFWQAQHNKVNTYYTKLNSTGNIKVVNMSVSYINETLPSSWVQLTPTDISQIIENTNVAVELNVTVPAFTNPGNYTGKLNISSENVPVKIINLTIEVMPSGTWYFLPTDNQTQEFSLGHTGFIANITIYNTGNIPLNFSIQYGNAGSENCLQFGSGGTCIDYNYLNAPASWELTGTDFIFVEKNSTSFLDLWQDNDDSEKHTNVGITITLTNSSATPVSNTTYMFFDIIDMPPSIYLFETRVNSLVKDYVELNKEINFNVIVTDDMSDFGIEGTKGVNDTETYFNITYPNSTVITLPATFVEEMPYSGDKDRFESNFVPTLAGNYTLLVYMVDISATPHPVNSTIYFYVYGKTTLDVAGQQVSTSEVSLNDGDTVFVPVTINNSGFAYAYNINITTDAGNFWSENKTIGNLSVSEQNTTTIEVQIPATTTPGSYPVTINAMYKNPDGTINTSSTIAAVIVLSNQTYYVSDLADGMIFPNIGHGKTNHVTFTVNGYGNSPSQDIIISTTGTPQGITLLLSKDNISFNPTTIVSVGNGATKTIYLDIIVDAGESPGTTNHEFDMHLVNSQLQVDYTNVKAFIMTDNSWNITHEDNITINGVSGENKLNHDIVITVNGNVPINFLFNLSGNTTSFMDVIDTARTLLPTENYTIDLNYTAPHTNNYYVSNLTIDDQIESTSNPTIQIRFNSFVFELNLTNLTAIDSLLNSDLITLSADLKYGSDYIVENTTYYVFIDGTTCPVASSIISVNKTIITCNAPPMSDGRWYNLSIKADYISSEGLVSIVKNLSYSVYYLDITPPSITAMNITESFEVNTNGTIDLTTEDNTQVDTATAIIRYPNGTIFNTLILIKQTPTQYMGIIVMPSQIGVYSVEYTINDTYGNLNNSVLDTFEVYGWKNFKGVITDLNLNPINVSFTVKEPSTNEIVKLFQTNSSGYYDVILKRRKYNIEMSFQDIVIQLENADFSDSPSDFINLDIPITGDYGYKGVVLKGFVVNTSLNSDGNITISYTPEEANGLTTNYFKVYTCSNWDYFARNCNSGLIKIVDSTHDKINRVITAPLTDFKGAYLLVEDEPVFNPEMTIPTAQLSLTAGHGKTTTAGLTIQSTGSVELTNIQISCSDGVACTDFIVASDPIIGLDPNANYEAPIDVTVPKYYAPGTYDGTLEITSNMQSVYAQYKAVTLRVTVPEDSNWSVTSNLTLDAVGSGITGQFGQIAITNLANVPIDFIIVPNTPYLVPEPDDITISKNNSDYITIAYTTPDEIGFYNHSINITGAGNTTVVYATMNITHTVNMTAIQPNTNIIVGQIITINATADYLGIPQTDNVTWSVFVDDTPCQNLSSSYAGSGWFLLCAAPNMSAKISYTLNLKGTFTGHENLVAYDSAYDLDNIYYVDALPPQVTYHTPDTEGTASDVTVNATITDYSNITAVSVTIISPNSTALVTMNATHVENNTYSITYNFTDVGDYILRYNLDDDLGNIGTQNKYFEVYKNMTFSGTVLNAHATGLQTSFTLYRENQSFNDAHIIHQFTSMSDGYYNETIHDRRYDVEMVANNNMIRLYDVNLTDHNDNPIDIDEVLGNEVQIIGTEEMGGVAVKTTITNAGRITISYVPDSDTKEDNIYIYHCSDWDFSNIRCDGTWDKLSRDDDDLDKINNKISADITGFSAYIAAEVTPPIVVDVTDSSSSSGGGGGGSGGMSSSIEDIKDKITALFEGTSEFSVDTKSISKQLYPGEFISFSLGVKNSLNQTSTMTASIIGEVSDFITFDTNNLELNTQEAGAISIIMTIPKETYPGIYEGNIQLSNNNVDTFIPVSIRVLDSQNLPISVDLQPLIDTVSPGASARLKLNIYNAGTTEIPLNYTISLIDPVTGIVLIEIADITTVASTKSIYLNISIPDNITLENPKLEGLNNIRTKRYMLKSTLSYTAQGHAITSDAVSFISVTSIVSLWHLSILGIPFWFILTLIALSLIVYFARTRYLLWLGSKKKYIESIDLKTLPQATPRSGFIGKLAETDIRTFLNLDTLQTHTVVAGATGGGKTISSQVIIEEALNKGVSVIVFDPTAQWTGFLRPNRNKKMLKVYRNFNMKVNQSKAYDGNIYEVRDAREIIDIKSHMTPGEITVFAMNHLDTTDIDFFVANTVKQVFHANFEESQELKLLIVYDEVHRLLKKYGGNGDGFIQIERAAREFRKWGVGLMLISQVLSDFIGTIKANIGTDIQFRTRDENDLERIRIKYGEDMMRSIVKAGIGEGMIENAGYNRGRPYVVSFRPILHAIERLSDSDLKKYSTYNSLIDDFNYQLECLKAENIDVFDLELEIKLTLDNLKKGKFNMVDIYLDGFKPKILDLWKNLGRQPPKRVIKYADRESIKKEVAKARLEHDIYIKKLKAEDLESKNKQVVKKDSNDHNNVESDGAESDGVGKESDYTIDDTRKSATTSDDSEKVKQYDNSEWNFSNSPDQSNATGNISAESKKQHGTVSKTGSNLKEPISDNISKKKSVYLSSSDDAKDKSKELVRIRSEVIGDIHKAARKEEQKKGIKRKASTVQKPIRGGTIQPSSSKTDTLESEVRSDYKSLMKKITELNKSGEDTSIINIEAMSIPADIDVAIAHEDIIGLKSIKVKINDLLKTL